MRDPGLDFQPRRPGALPLVLLLAAGLLCLDAWLDWQELGGRQRQVEQQLAQTQQRLAGRQHPGREPRPGMAAFSPEQARALDQVATAIAFDWEAIYRAIDRATSDEIALLSIVPETAGRSLVLAGEGRDLKAVLAYVESLPGPALMGASLAAHRLKHDDPQRPVVFEIIAQWKSSP